MRVIKCLTLSHGLVTQVEQAEIPVFLFDFEQEDVGILVPGPQGIQGVAGIAGIAGVIGPPGTDAEQGEDGIVIPPSITMPYYIPTTMQTEWRFGFERPEQRLFRQPIVMLAGQAIVMGPNSALIGV